MTPSASSSLSPAVCVLLLSLVAAIGLGIARFAYALVLPDMRESLGWSWTTAGALNTVNAAGYLAGAAAAARTMRLLGAWRCLVLGGALATLTVAACGLTSALIPIGLARFAAGLGGGLGFVAGGVLAATVASAGGTRGARTLALFYTGPGLGIVVSGALTPLLIEGLGPGSWWIAWLALGAVCALMLAVLMAFGGWEAASRGSSPHGPAPLGRMAFILAGYTAFGAGYIAYMTFMIAYVRDGGGSAAMQALFWIAVGASGASSPWLWSRLIGASRGGMACAVLTAVTLVGSAIPLAHAGTVGLFVSAFLFGSAFFAVVTGTTAFVRVNLPPPRWASGVAAMTVAFGLGQVVGPLVTGAIADMVGGLDAGLMVSTALLALGAALFALQRGLAPDGGA